MQLEPLRVLLVEGSVDAAALIEREIKSAGHETQLVRVASRERLLEELQRTGAAWDIVIADYELTGFSGLEAIAAIRQIHLDLPVIVVSGTSGEEAAVAVMKAGASDFVLKERLTRLAPSIEREIREYRQRQAHRQVRIKLLDMQENFKAFMNNSPVIAFLKDRDGRLLYANETFERVFKTDVTKYLGKTPADLYPAEYAEQFQRNDNYVLEHNRPLEVIETAPHADGVHYWLITKFPMPKSSGPSLLGAIGIDITERRRLEEQLRQSQKMEAIGHLAGGVAHDFNNLLTIIMGRTDLLLRGVAEADPARGELMLIRGTAERAGALTRQLLQFSRQQMLTMRVINLNEVIVDVKEMLCRLIGEHIELVTRLEPKLVPVAADSSQVQQIILNLAVNSRDAMKDGGRLLIETANIELDAEYAMRHSSVVPGKYAVLSVSDTGVGMDDAVRARLFEPFFTTKEMGKGTGLGLSTVYGIVKQSGGNIWVYSEPGKGTTFKVYLPESKDTKVVSAASSAEMSAVAPGSKVILVAEDEEAVRELIGEVLTVAGFTVLTASNGEEALAVSDGHNGEIHLLLTDLVMPRMSGGTLAAKLVPQRPTMKVLFMSGYASHMTDRTGIPDGMFYLDKPFTPDKLLKRVNEALSERRNLAP